MHDKLFDPLRAGRLLSEERRQLLPMKRLTAKLGDVEGQSWIEIGAGTGFATLPLAHAVGGSGRIWAVDLQEPMLALLRERLRKAAVVTVEPVLAPAESLPIDDGAADGVLTVAVFHELEDRARALAEIRRVLRPGGQLVILDWLHPKDATAPLPEAGPPADHRLRTADVERMVADAGFDSTLHLDWFNANYALMARRR